MPEGRGRAAGLCDERGRQLGRMVRDRTSADRPRAMFPPGKDRAGRLAVMVLAGILTLGGCAGDPDFQPPPVNIPAAYRGPVEKVNPQAANARSDPSGRLNPFSGVDRNPGPPSDPPQTARGSLRMDDAVHKAVRQDRRGTVRSPASQPLWWQRFGSDELTLLVETAIRDSFDVAAARSRLDQARAFAGAAGADMLPTLGASLDTSLDNPINTSSTSGSKAASDRITRTYRFGLDARYEVDLWGKNAAALDSALSQVTVNFFERRKLMTDLSAEVATAYLQYLGWAERLRVAEKNLANMKAVLAVVGERLKLGDGSEIEISQQEALVAEASALLPRVSVLKEHAFNRLAALLGRSPADLHLSRALLTDIKSPDVVAGIPSDLLLQRADIRRALAALAGAHADVAVARGQLLPSFSLTGTLGVGSTALSTLLAPGSVLYSLGANLVNTLFDGGKGASRLAVTENRYRELAAIYQQTIIQALREVEDALEAVHHADAQVRAQRWMVATARRSIDLTRRAFSLGDTDYATVLDAQRTQFRAEEQFLDALTTRLVASVELARALGGAPSEDPDDPCAGPAPTDGRERPDCLLPIASIR